MKELKFILHAVCQFCWGAIGGAYLLFLYAITIFFAVFLLSAIQVREKVRDEIKGNFIVNFHDVISSHDKFIQEKEKYNLILTPVTHVDQDIDFLEYIMYEKTLFVSEYYFDMRDVYENPQYKRYLSDYLSSSEYRQREASCAPQKYQPTKNIS